MYNFKQYLEEGRDAPLYHGTRSKETAVKILKSNKFIANETHPGEHHTTKKSTKKNAVCFSRLINSRFVLYKEVVFVINQRKLSQRYKIIPVEIEYEWFGSRPYRPRESEIFEEYITRDLVDLDKYILKIILDNRLEKWFNNIKGHGKSTEYDILINHPLVWGAWSKQWLNK